MPKNILEALKGATPTLLSVIAGAGLIGTTLLAIKATPKAIKKLDEEINKRKTSRSNALIKKPNGDYALPVKDTLEFTWRFYIPTAITGGATLACIVGANMMSGKQISSISSAYALIRTQYDGYRSKVKEIYGEDAHDSIMECLAVEHPKDVYLHCEGGFSDNSLSIGDSNPEEKILFYDGFGGRYFEKTLSDVIEAEYHLNRNYSLGGFVTLKEFYDFLGLTPIKGSDNLGWTGEDGIAWIDFDHNLVTLDDGLECVIIDMAFLPGNIEEYL